MDDMQAGAVSFLLPFIVGGMGRTVWVLYAGGRVSDGLLLREPEQIDMQRKKK